MNPKRIIKIFISFVRQFSHLFKKNQISLTSELSSGCTIHGCKIGKYCFIGPNCNLLNVDIGAYSSIAPGVQIGGLEHPIEELSTSTRLSIGKSKDARTTIGPDVWIAGSSVIRQGVNIGQGAVVGANSFVNKDVPPYAIVVGSPAKILRYRFDATKIETLLKSRYYTLPPQKAREELARLESKKEN